MRRKKWNYIVVRGATVASVALIAACLMLVGVLYAQAGSGSSTSGANEQTLYEFQGGQNGFYPLGAMLADKAGDLFGTTLEGGTIGSCENSYSGCGTVFEVSPPKQPGGVWTQTVIYKFLGSDGAAPQDPLITDGQGNLYGAAEGGGETTGCPGGCGVVFELSPPAKKGGAWTETVLHYFKGVPSGNGVGDAAAPNNIVLGSDGNIYGTAYRGGNCTTGEGGEACSGAAFELIRPTAPSGAWTEKILYIWNVRSGTGAPDNAFMDKFGDLNGTVGGGEYGFGEVFSLSPTTKGLWTLTSIHDFASAPDGAFPVQGLSFDAAGNAYGATLGGGNGTPGDGTIYELQPPSLQGGAWMESVLFTFEGTATGYEPETGPIVDSAGNIYATASGGGSTGYGSIFKLAPQQGGGYTQTFLYNFPGGDSGNESNAITFGKGGAIYGTSSLGGMNGNGMCGTLTCGFVFGVAP